MKKTLSILVVTMLMLTGCSSGDDGVRYIVIKDGHYITGDSVIKYENNIILRNDGIDVGCVYGDMHIRTYRSQADLDAIKREFNLK